MLSAGNLVAGRGEICAIAARRRARRIASRGVRVHVQRSSSGRPGRTEQMTTKGDAMRCGAEQFTTGGQTGCGDREDVAKREHQCPWRRDVGKPTPRRPSDFVFNVFAGSNQCSSSILHCSALLKTAVGRHDAAISALHFSRDPTIVFHACH